jgi:hypothetical protein
MSFRNKKLLNAVRDQPCVLCGSLGTTVAAHANSVALGKGTGIKAPDYYTAWVCQHCHDVIDGRSPVSGTVYRDRQEMWTVAFLRTVARWFELGVVKVG